MVLSILYFNIFVIYSMQSHWLGGLYHLLIQSVMSPNGCCLSHLLTVWYLIDWLFIVFVIYWYSLLSHWMAVDSLCHLLTLIELLLTVFVNYWYSLLFDRMTVHSFCHLLTQSAVSLKAVHIVCHLQIQSAIWQNGCS